MPRKEKIIVQIEQLKPWIWGIFLASTLFKFAIGNIAFALLFVVFLVQISIRHTIFFQNCFLPISMYFGWAVASVLWSTHPTTTLSGIGMSAPLLIVPFMAAQYQPFTTAELQKSIRVFSCFLLFYFAAGLLKALFCYFQSGTTSLFFYHELVSVFHNNAIYISLAVSVCILFLFLALKKNKTDLFIIVFLFIYLLLLSSKNFIITTTMLMFGIYFFKTKNKKYLTAGSLILIPVFLGLLTFSNPVKKRFLQETNTSFDHVWQGTDFYDYPFNGSEVRIFQWRVMAEMIENDQVGLLGLGLHNTDYLLQQYFSYYNLYKGYFYINFHNQYLQTLGELGFIGLMFFLFIFVDALRRAFHQKNTYLMVFTLLIVIAFFTESFLNRQKGIFLVVIFFSIVHTFSRRPVKNT